MRLYNNIPLLEAGWIGGAEVFGSNTCTVTLGSPTQYTTPLGWRGVRVMVASSEATGLAPLGSGFVHPDIQKRRPVITTSVGPAYGLAPGYPNSQNQITFSDYQAVNYQWIDHPNGKTFMIRGGWDYLIFTPIPTGGTITVSYAHLDHTLEWLAVKVHRCFNIDTINSPQGAATYAGVGDLTADPNINAIPTYWLQNLIVGTMISSDPNDGLYMSGFDGGSGSISQNATGEFRHTDAWIGYSTVSITGFTAHTMRIQAFNTAVHAAMIQAGSKYRPVGPAHRTKLISM